MRERLSANLFWQPTLAVLYIAVVLFALNHTNSSQVIWAIGAGALSSSSCIVFASPHSKSGRPLQLVKGYLIGIAVGVSVHVLLKRVLPLFDPHVFVYGDNAFWVLACIAVGLTMIVIILCDVFHPPAVGMALVLVLDIQHYTILGVILLAALALSLMRYILNPYLKDLVH